MHEVEVNLSEILLSGLFALGVFAVGGVPRRISTRAVIGLLAGIALGGIIWVFGVSETKLGVHILLECMAAGLVVGAALEPEPTP